MKFSFLQRTSIGIDIDDGSIEAVEVSLRNKKLRVLNQGRVVLPVGIVQNGQIKKADALRGYLSKVLRESKPHSIVAQFSLWQKIPIPKIVLSLSETQIYTKNFSISEDGITYNEIIERTLEQVRTNVPFNESDILYTFKIIKEKGGQTKVVWSALSRQILQDWVSFFKSININLDYIDSEPLALWRGLVVKPEDLPVMVVDFGSNSTLVFIYSASGLSYTYTIPIGGNHLTQAIEKTWNVSFDNAEQIKIKLGLLDPEQKLTPILKTVLDAILQEIQYGLSDFWDKRKEAVKKIILTGGGGMLKGVTAYCKESFGIESVLADMPLRSYDPRPEYIEACGAALAGFDQDFTARDPLFGVHKNQKIKKYAFLPEKVEENETSKDLFSPLRGLLIFLKIFKEGMLSKNVSVEEKTIFQKNVMIFVFIFGFLAIVGAFFYRNHQNNQLFDERQAKTTQYAVMQPIKILASIVLPGNQITPPNSIRGRIFEDRIDIESKYDQIIFGSRARAEAQINPGEILWPEVLDKINPNTLEFPLKVRWMVYDGSQADTIFLTRVDALDIIKDDYIVNEIKKLNIYPTNTSTIWEMEARVVISTHQFFDLPIENTFITNKAQTASSTPEIVSNSKLNLKEQEVLASSTTVNTDVGSVNLNSEIKSAATYVKVKNTETGWLNVRLKPDVKSELVTKIYPGESYPLLEFNEKWCKIQLKGSLMGWVSNFYIEKVIN